MVVDKSKLSADDMGLYYLNEDLKKNAPIGIISGNTANGLSELCSFFIQWEDIIQSFETAYVTLIGLLRDKYDVLQKYDVEIMQSLDFHKIWNRNEISLFDYIKHLHSVKGIKLSENDLKETKSILDEFISKDENGILFVISPLLSFLNSIINVYLDENCKSVAFIINEKYTTPKNAMDVFAKLLLFYFPESNGKPVYFDVTKDSFAKYMIDNNCLKPNTVVVTNNSQLITYIASDKNLEGITVIYPETNRYKLKNEYSGVLSVLHPTVEFICYKNKPFILEKPKNK